MPRAGLSVGAVVDAATALVDAEGLEGLTLARLASALGIKPPSLYNHVQCLGTLKAFLQAKAMTMLVDNTRDAMAGVAGYDALVAFGQTQRRFARDHPGLWSAFKLPAAAWNEAATGAAALYLALALAVVRGYSTPAEEAMHAVRVMRAALQGFIDLELGGGFGLPLDIDQSFESLLHMLDRSLKQSSPGT